VSDKRWKDKMKNSPRLEGEGESEGVVAERMKVG